MGSKAQLLRDLDALGGRGACGKIRYLSRAMAKAKSRQLKASGQDRRPGEPLCVYRCERCGGDWHVGHDTHRGASNRAIALADMIGD